MDVEHADPDAAPTRRLSARYLTTATLVRLVPIGVVLLTGGALTV